MKRLLVLGYGLISYAIFFAAFLYSIGFVGNFLVPKSIDAAEHSTYVLFSSVALILLFVFWQPLGGMVWQLTSPAAQFALYGAYAFGCGLILLSTCLVNHFDLFGLRQTWLCFRGRDYTPVNFVEPWLYRIVRHPLYAGWFFAFRATPPMTVTHLVFAVATTVYILIAIQLEERDLQDAHPEYPAYKRRVPMLIPRFRFALGASGKRLQGSGHIVMPATVNRVKQQGLLAQCDTLLHLPEDKGKRTRGRQHHAVTWRQPQCLLDVPIRGREIPIMGHGNPGEVGVRFCHVRIDLDRPHDRNANDEVRAATRSCGMLASRLSSSSDRPSAK